MTYNSQREELIIPEYGRNIQNLMRHARNIENLDTRQAYVEHIVGLMMQMHPQNRNLDDYREKMWKHAFRVADYNLPGVFPPNGVIPSPEDIQKRPESIPYPAKESRFRHYGHHIQKLIDKAISMEDSPVKNGFIEVIGSYMKLAYRTWNKEHYVSDDVIISDLEKLSRGKLKMVEDASLDNLTQANRRRKRNSGSSSSSSNSGRSNSRRSSRGDRDRDRYKRRRK